MSVDPSMAGSPSHHLSIRSSIVGAFRQNRLPCLVLNILVVGLVATYFFWPAAAGVWQSVAAFKTRWSFVFSLISTVLAAAVLPFLIQRLMGMLPEQDRTKRLVSLMLFWGYRGMEIDLFYRLQGLWFGHGNDAATLIKKVAMDQFVYSTLWAVPSYLIALRWVDCGCSWVRTRASMDRHFWTHTYPTVLVTNWLIWMPALAFVYSLPAPLQFPLFTIVMCFFILIATLVARVPKSK